ncbi:MULTISPECIES: OmpH family outer membrane protein [unclassified Acidovorax]|jgi:hypothetical protein|uniref:OmpH family outer membrane protein n=1 Tax=unclassified Acidovorax TaxID=2684926 RepID=UPI0025C2F753|nr:MULTISPECIES: OmpH family outer membrane protein [unclassified Acidovorax]HQS19645.1 OmpH family outer membrane protein [Acidovorax defluvii]HQS64246.1 OmpH family outer membrane protein [Acidovorax defluvii]HQT17905.1 OmpH family outer membrane protein [Acidovorax defluvii]HQT48180.1 OmpH family outer membrane protein [Acidovorax defluvii]
MLSFATEFPVEATRTSVDFLAAVREWLLGSPHTAFEASDLSEIEAKDEFSAKKSNELIETLKYQATGSDMAAIRYTKLDRGLEWVSTIVFSRGQPSWIGIRTSCESQHPAAKLPIAKKPVFVQTFLTRLGGGADGEIKVQAIPLRLTNSDIPLAARCVSGRAGCRLPLVYVSARFQGGHLVNVDSLAEALAGMAHVVVEPNRPFSVRLMSEVNSQNVYGGAIGVYWPEGGGRRSFFLHHESESPSEMERAVVEEVRSALVNRRPLARVTWSAVQELISRRTFAALRDQGSTEVQRYVDEFDKELKSKQEELEDAEREIARLEAEVRKYQAQSPMQSGLFLQTAPEQDLYAGELLGVVGDAIADAVTRVTEDSRRQHILKSIVAANPPTGEAEAMRNRLKSLLRDFRSMEAKVRSALQDMGFEISEEGKHYKIVFQGDERYTFTMPKSGSDHRGGLNLAGDISRLLL